MAEESRGGGAGSPRDSDHVGATGSPGGTSRASRLDSHYAQEARITELLEENNKLLQRARDAETEVLRWFKMSKDLLAVAGEFAKLMAKP